jgi:uncharacterized protein involved in exopolysaccharide biosynthesis
MDLKQCLDVLWRQRIVVGAVLFIGVLVFTLAATKSRKYTATASILSVSSSSQNAAVLDPRKDPIESAIALADIPSILGSSTLIKNVGRDLHLSEAATQRLAGSVKAKPSLGSNVLPVTVTDSDPDRAIVEANAVVRQLQKYVQQIAMVRYDQLIRDLTDQLRERGSALGELDRRIDRLTTADPYITYANGTEAISTRLTALKAQHDQLEAAVRGDRSAAELLARRPAIARDLASEQILQNDPVVQNFRDQYGKDLARFETQRAGYTDAFPGMSGLRNQVEREGASVAASSDRAAANPAKSAAYVSAQLDQNKAMATLAADEAQLASVDRQIAAAQEHLTGSHDENVSLASLHRDRESGNQSYAQLAERLAIARADRAQAASINTIVLLDPATYSSLALLSRPTVIGAALAVIFLWLAITLAFIADRSDVRLRHRTKIEELYGRPVYGSVG